MISLQSKAKRAFCLYLSALGLNHLCAKKILSTVIFLSFWTDRTGQTVQTLIRVYTVCNSLCIIWMHYSKETPSCSIFMVITTNFLGVRIFRKFTVCLKNAQLDLVCPGVRHQSVYIVPQLNRGAQQSANVSVFDNWATIDSATTTQRPWRCVLMNLTPLAWAIPFHN